MRKRIKKYHLAWHPLQKKAAVLLELEDGTKEQIAVPSPEELAALAAILRESPVFLYDTGVVGTIDQEPEA